MSKWYEVRVSIWKTVVVEVGNGEDEDSAASLAYDEYLCGEDGEVSTPKLLATEVELQSAHRHASRVLPL